MKSIHSDIQKSIDWSNFGRADLLYGIKLILEKLGEVIEDQLDQRKEKLREEGKINRLMESYKLGKLPPGAIQIDSLPPLRKEIQGMISRAKEEFVNLPNSSSMVFRPAVKLENGETYEGQWTKEGKRHGVGTGIYPDGSVYQGFWANDQKDGIGRFVNEREHFEGVYKDNQICEVGLYKFLKSSLIDGNADQNNEEVEEKAYFTIDPDLWQRLGFEFLILNKKESNEITISRSLEEMGPSESIKIHETGEIEHLTISGESKLIKRRKIYPTKNFGGFF